MKRSLFSLADYLKAILAGKSLPPELAAEAATSPLVIGRKISAGSRSTEGSDDRMILSSVLQTALLRGEDPYQTCFAFLAAPDPPASP